MHTREISICDSPLSLHLPQVFDLVFTVIKISTVNPLFSKPSVLKFNKCLQLVFSLKILQMEGGHALEKVTVQDCTCTWIVPVLINHQELTAVFSCIK